MINHLTCQTRSEWHTKNDGTRVKREKWRFTFRTRDKGIFCDAANHLIGMEHPFTVDFWQDMIVLRFMTAVPEEAEGFAEHFKRYTDGQIGELLR